MKLIELQAVFSNVIKDPFDIVDKVPSQAYCFKIETPKDSSGEGPVPVILHNDLKITVDEDGFLADLEEWSEAVARGLAAQEGITELAEDQLDILKFMREYYIKHKFFPIVRYVCKNVDQPRNCVTDKFMDPVTAWKIAGLPNPGEEVIKFKAWEPLGF